MKLPVSGGFLSALGGVAITIYAWFSSAIWPAWPALAALPLVGDYLDPSSRIREAVVVFLIALNIAAWGAAIHVVAILGRRLISVPEARATSSSPWMRSGPGRDAPVARPRARSTD